jgi:alkyl hydroperoxide reductase subunit AhpC
MEARELIRPEIRPELKETAASHPDFADSIPRGPGLAKPFAYHQGAPIMKLGDEAPDFDAVTTHGKISFHRWKEGAWAVLFSHPRDFTPVCTTELGAVAALIPEFERRNTKVIGLSVDSVDSHKRWLEDVAEVTGHRVEFPLIADTDRKVATKYDMLHEGAADTMTVRSVFVVDPTNKIRLMVTYPASTGRSFPELLRAIDSLQLTSRHSLATPANWKQGDPVIITPSVSDEDAARRFPGYKTIKPYLRTTAQPK